MAHWRSVARHSEQPLSTRCEATVRAAAIVALLLSVGTVANAAPPRHPRLDALAAEAQEDAVLILIIILLLWLTGNLHMSGGNMMGGGRY